MFRYLYFCGFLIIGAFFGAINSADAQAVVRIVDEARFELAPIPEGYKTLKAPACIPQEVISRYPDTVTRLSARVSCANVRMNARIYEEQISAMDESLQVIATNRMLLQKSLEKLNQKKTLENLGEGVVMSAGVKSDRYHIGALFTAKCVVPPDADKGNGEPVGTLNPKFRKTDPVFVATTKDLQTTLTTTLPSLFGTLGELIAEKSPPKVKIAYYATRVVANFSPFMVVGREFFDEAFPGQKPLLTTEMTLSNEKKCNTAGQKFYVIRLGDTSLKACFNPVDVPIAGDLVKATKKGIQERFDEFEKHRTIFEKEKARYERDMAFFKKQNQRCF